MLTDLASIIDYRENNDVETVVLMNAFRHFLNEYKHLPLFRQLKNMDLSASEKLFFVLIIARNLNGKQEVDIDAVAVTIFSKIPQLNQFPNSPQHLHQLNN